MCGRSNLVHKTRGRPSNNRIWEDVRDRALELIRAQSPDFSPTLAAEMLADRHELKASRETLRGWMIEAGLWLSRKQRRSSTNHGCAVRPWAISCRSTAASIAGSRIERTRARSGRRPFAQGRTPDAQDP